MIFNKRNIALVLALVILSGSVLYADGDVADHGVTKVSARSLSKVDTDDVDALENLTTTAPSTTEDTSDKVAPKSLGLFGSLYKSPIAASKRLLSSGLEFGEQLGRVAMASTTAFYLSEPSVLMAGRMANFMKLLQGRILRSWTE